MCSVSCLVSLPVDSQAVIIGMHMAAYSHPCKPVLRQFCGCNTSLAG